MNNISTQEVLKNTFNHLNKVVDEKKKRLDNENRKVTRLPARQEKNLGKKSIASM